MSDLNTLPIEDLYESTLQSDLSATDMSAVVVKPITGTLTGGLKTYMGINYDRPSRYELVEIDAITGATVSISERDVINKSGGTSGVAKNHAAGSKVIITHNYKLFKDIQTAVNSKADGTPVLDGSGSVYPNDTARNAAVPSPVEGYEVVSGGVKQVYIGGTWQDLDVGTPTPNASTTVAGKVEIATQSEANAGTDTGSTGALLSVVPSNLAVLAQDNKYTYAGTTAGSSTVYTATVTPAPSAYAAGQGFTVLMDETNGASPTINFNGLGAKSIVDASGVAIGAGILPSGALVDLKYNGTSFQVMNVTPSTIPQLLKFQVNSTVAGSSTTQFDITNPSGTTFRYTYDGTGTDPVISSTTCPIGTIVRIMGTNFTASNTGNFIVTGSGTNYFEVTNASGVAEANKTIGSGALYLQTGTVYIGDSTTQFDVTNTSGTTYRYTYDATGTDPAINTNRLKVGDVVDVQGQNFASGNKGMFAVTGVGANYFEVTNASGVAETNKTLGTGYLAIGMTYTARTGVKYVEFQGVAGGAGTEDVTNDGSAGGGAGGYFFKRLSSTSLSSPTNIIVGKGGLYGTSLALTQAGARTLFGSIIASGGSVAASTTKGGKGGLATGGDINIRGGDGGAATSSGPAGYGGASYMSNSVGDAYDGDYNGQDGYEYGGGASGAYENSGIRPGGNGANGILLGTEYY